MGSGGLKLLLAVTFATTLLTASSALDSEFGPADEPLKILRIKSPVKLDGLSDEAAWEGFRSLPMVMRMPNFGDEPSERTEILLGYDDDYLYAAGRFYDSQPSKIQAATLKRDIWTSTSDAMGIVLDAFHDNENAIVLLLPRLEHERM